MEEYKKPEEHPCYVKEKGLLFGWICPYCMKIYPTDELAAKCKESHDSLEVDYVFEKGHRFPVEILVRRVKGKNPVEIGTYKMERLEILDEEGKVKETKTSD